MPLVDRRLFCRLMALLFALGLTAEPLPAAAAGATPVAKWVAFAKGKVEVQLPPNIAAREDSEGNLTGTFGPGGANRLELSLIDHEKDEAPADTAEQFIEYYERQRKLEVHSNGDKAVVMEGAEATLDGKPMRIARWQIGFGKSIVVMTLAAPVEKTLSPALKQFLEQDLDPMIQSVRRRG